MISGIGATLSGLGAFGKKLSNAANNIANSNTNGYKKTEAAIVEDSAGLPEVIMTPTETPGSMVEEPDGKTFEMSNVEIPQEFGEMIIAQRGWEANIKALKAQNDMLGSVLDILV